MKKIIYPVACFLFECLVLCSCGSVTHNTDFIPGTYVREVHNEFSIGWDTLAISFNQTNFSVIHTGSNQRIKEGKLLPLKNIHENWTVIYDENKKILIETRRGKILSFDPSKNILFLGSSIYKKIK